MKDDPQQRNDQNDNQTNKRPQEPTPRYAPSYSPLRRPPPDQPSLWAVISDAFSPGLSFHCDLTNLFKIC